MVPYNGKKIIFHKSDLAMLFDLDGIGKKIINFINDSAAEAEKVHNVKCSGYTLIFIPGINMDIMLTFLLFDDNSAIVLVALPTCSGYGINNEYLKTIMSKIKEAALNIEEEK
jgi:hypothetical protein